MDIRSSASDGHKADIDQRPDKMHRQRMPQGVKVPLRSLTRHANSTMPQLWIRGIALT